MLEGCSTTSPTPTPAPTPTQPAVTGAVTISGKQFLRDGVAWIPHGVVSTAFNASPATRGGFFLMAYNNLNATEIAAMKTWGADTIRFQVSQPALDPQNSLYDSTFIGYVQKAVAEARAIGLNVIISVQDESGSGEPNPTQLPNASTGRDWQIMAPLFKGDTGVLFEIMNEPQGPATTANYAAWATAMNNMITIIRGSGAKNVLIADGLAFAQQLTGAPTLADPLAQVAYASHPYFNNANDQTPAAWDTKFGNFAAITNAPVLVTEWSTEFEAGVFAYCDTKTPTAALAFLQYLQTRGIGLTAFSYDLPNEPRVPRVGRIVQDFNATPSTYSNNAGCTDGRFGPGTLIQNWFRSGTVSTVLQ